MFNPENRISKFYDRTIPPYFVKAYTLAPEYNYITISQIEYEAEKISEEELLLEDY